MLYIDLDQFKIINDTAGHEAGDEALKQVAMLLKGITPAGAVLSRLGGDEFAVILTDCQLVEAVAFGREILHLLEESEFYWQTARFSFSASIGLRMIDETAAQPSKCTPRPILRVMPPKMRAVTGSMSTILMMKSCGAVNWKWSVLTSSARPCPSNGLSSMPSRSLPLV